MEIMGNLKSKSRRWAVRTLACAILMRILLLATESFPALALWVTGHTTRLVASTVLSASIASSHLTVTAASRAVTLGQAAGGRAGVTALLWECLMGMARLEL